MVDHLNIRLSLSRSSHALLADEICEHKGIGHPDSICDGVAEAVSQALCAAYLHEYGEIRHHNVDKALLIGGQSAPKFGGGKVETPIRLIIAGRADPLRRIGDIASIVCAAARSYIDKTLRCPPDLFEIESAVRSGSPNLRRVISGAVSQPLSNDTSFGVGFAPYSQLEKVVLQTARLLKSPAFLAEFPMTGDDFKVMGMRVDNELTLTIAIAFIAREVECVEHYFTSKSRMAERLAHSLGTRPSNIRINTLDNIDARDETGIYLTVTGLSAEHGDDGQVGRGNRVSGLITPSRPMSLEAAAGKNPVSHVGKIYNVLAARLADELVSEVPVIREATIQILSAIGAPLNRPQLVDIQVASEALSLDTKTTTLVRNIVNGHFGRLSVLTSQLSRGEIHVF